MRKEGACAGLQREKDRLPDPGLREEGWRPRVRLDEARVWLLGLKEEAWEV